MQRASRLLVLTFGQRALVYTRRARIDWERVDEVQLRAERSDGVVLCNPTHHLNLFSSQCTPATQRNKKGAGEPTTCLERESRSLKSSEIDPVGSLSSISPCSVAPLITYLSLAFWRAQMATRITAMAHRMPLWYWQALFSPFHTQTRLPSAHVYSKQTHTQTFIRQQIRAKAQS